MKFTKQTAESQIAPYVLKKMRIKLQDRISNLRDKELQKQFTEEELQYLLVGLSSLITVKKVGIPISVYVNEHVYKICSRIFVKLGGNTQWLVNNTPFIHEIERWEEEIKKSKETIKNLEEPEMFNELDF